MIWLERLGIPALMVAVGCGPSVGADDATSAASTGSGTGGAGPGGGASGGPGSLSSGAGPTADSGFDSGGGCSDPPCTDVPIPACVNAEQCELFSDCCQCSAVPVGTPTVECPADCEIGMCEALGITLAECSADSDGMTMCVPANDCNTQSVVCRADAPVCQPGSLPTVLGDCWSGLCIPVTSCRDVDSCAVCQSLALLCVPQSSPDALLCRSTEGCLPPASCDCLGPNACNPGYLCIDTPDGPACEFVIPD